VGLYQTLINIRRVQQPALIAHKATQHRYQGHNPEQPVKTPTGAKEGWKAAATTGAEVAPPTFA